MRDAPRDTATTPAAPKPESAAKPPAPVPLATQHAAIGNARIAQFLTSDGPEPDKPKPKAVRPPKGPGAKPAESAGHAPRHAAAKHKAAAPAGRAHGKPARAKPRPAVDIPTPLFLAAPRSRAPGAKPYDPIEARAQTNTLLQQLADRATLRKAALRERGAAVKQHIVEEGGREAGAAMAAATHTEKEIEGEVAKARASVAGHAAASQGLARLAALTAWTQILHATTDRVTAIEKSRTDHQAAALKQVTDRQKQARDFGAAEGKRGRLAIQAQIQDAATRGQTKAASYPADERGKVQANAALQVAGEVVAELQKPLDKIETKSVEQGNDLADGFEGAADNAIKAIGDQAPQLGQQLSGEAMGQLPLFLEIGETASKAIGGFAHDIDQRLAGVGRDAHKELAGVRTSLRQQFAIAIWVATHAVDAEVAGMAVAIDQIVSRTAATVQSAQRPDPDAVREGIKVVDGMIDDAAEGFGEGLGELELRAATSYAEASTAATGALARVATATVGHLAGLATSAEKSFADALKLESDELTKAVTKWTDGLADAQKQIEVKWDELVTGVGTELDKGFPKGKAEITKSVDKTITENAKAATGLDEHMQEAADDAAWRYDHPIRAKLLGVLKGIGKALLVIVAIVLIIKLAIALIVSGVVALVVIGIILIVAVVVFVVYSVVTGIINRVKSGKTLGQKIWGGFVGVFDIVGVPNIIEGITEKDIVNGSELSKEEAGERLGGGIVGLIGAIFMVRGIRAMRAGPSVPVDVPPELPVDPLKVDPVKGVDPAKAPDPVKGTDAPDPTKPADPAQPADPVDRPADKAIDERADKVADDAAAERAKADKAAADQAAAERAKAEQPKTEQPKVEQPKVEQPKVEQPKTEQPKTEQPKTEQPKPEQPKTEQPKVEQPKVEKPKVEQPKLEKPKVEQPKLEKPKVEQPKTEPPKVEDPKVDKAADDAAAKQAAADKAATDKQAATDQKSADKAKADDAAARKQVPDAPEQKPPPDTDAEPPKPDKAAEKAARKAERDAAREAKAAQKAAEKAAKKAERDAARAKKAADEAAQKAERKAQREAARQKKLADEAAQKAAKQEAREVAREAKRVKLELERAEKAAERAEKAKARELAGKKKAAPWKQRKVKIAQTASDSVELEDALTKRKAAGFSDADVGALRRWGKLFEKYKKLGGKATAESLLGDLGPDFSENAYQAFRHRLFKACIDLILDADETGKPRRPAADQATMLDDLLGDTPDPASKGSLNSKFEGKRLPADSKIKTLDGIKKRLDDPQKLLDQARDSDRTVKVEDQQGRKGPPDGDYGVDDKAGKSFNPDQAKDVSKLAESDDGLSIGGRKLAGYIYWCQTEAQAIEVAGRLNKLGLSNKLHVAFIDEAGEVVWRR